MMCVNAISLAAAVKIYGLEKGVNDVQSNQFWILVLLETWITPDKPYGAIS